MASIWPANSLVSIAEITVIADASISYNIMAHHRCMILSVNEHKSQLKQLTRKPAVLAAGIIAFMFNSPSTGRVDTDVSHHQGHQLPPFRRTPILHQVCDHGVG
jgi:hypothetical protein